MPTDVAIITRTKNRPILLKRTIASVRAQTFVNWTHVIVNDGGDPATVDTLIDEFEDRDTKYLRIDHDESKGMEAASNAGLKASDSRYVIILDDDDSWHPEFLSRMVEYLDKTGDMGAVSLSVTVVEMIEGDSVIETRRDLWRDTVSISIMDMMRENQFPPVAFLYRRQVFDEIGYYDESLPVLGDWDFNIRFMVEHDISVLRENLAYYHHRKSTRNAAYLNTVGTERHVVYNAILRNRILRAGLKDSEQANIGLLINLGHELNDLRMKVEEVQRCSKKSNLVSTFITRILYPFRWLRRKVLK